jgi:hypothetical protein
MHEGYERSLELSFLLFSVISFFRHSNQRFNGARWHALNLASCFTPLTLHLTLVSMRQELLEDFEILLACQHLILLAVAASDRLELTHLANLSNEQPSIDES